MKSEIERFLEEFNKVIEESSKFLYLVRDKFYQKEAINKLIKFKQQAANLKEKMISDYDEESANILLSIENIIKAIINELQMLIALKEDKVNKAWDYLVNAQCAIRSALQSHEIALNLKLNIERYAEKLHLIERLIFPPQIFFSPGVVVEETKCSICGQNYEECEHIDGKAYMGKICKIIITKVMKEKEIEVSFVPNPENKKARIFIVKEGGITRDYMTWRIITNEDKRENFEDGIS